MTQETLYITKEGLKKLKEEEKKELLRIRHKTRILCINKNREDINEAIRKGYNITQIGNGFVKIEKKITLT